MGETRCPVDGKRIIQQAGPGRPRTYCDPRCRRRAERIARAARNWAMADPALRAMVDEPALGVVDLDVDALNRAMRRMR
jgi:hypothetical protein